jgi:hypothetical protein
MAREARDAGIIGMNASEVHALLGEPDWVESYRAGALTWEYKQLPGYWMSSRLQVHFEGDHVAVVEPNDD